MLANDDPPLFGFAAMLVLLAGLPARSVPYGR